MAQPDPLGVSVIGGPLRLGGDDAAAAVLRRATAQGLVRLDEAGVVTPGLADRWIVLDDGQTVIFRLGEVRWADGTPVTAAAVRRQLRATLGRGADPASRAAASAVAEVNAVIPTILELRLRHARPDLLQLLAQPIFALTAEGGSGPLRARRERGGWTTLARPENDSDAGDIADLVRLRSDAAASALARYAEGQVDVVLGGTLRDWPIARAAGGDPPLIDPSEGLFGLQVVRRTGLLETAEGRRALSLALDRGALATVLGLPEDWPRATLIAGGPPLVAPQLEPARGLVTAWRADHGGQAPVVTLATPAGPGGRLLAAWLMRQWAAIGLQVELVDNDAQLRLLDRVAPTGDPATTMALIGCGRVAPCGADVLAALGELTNAATLAEWRDAQVAAYRALAEDHAVLPLGRPVRWSVIRPGTPGVLPNPRAIHPLTRMVAATSAEAP